MYTRDNLPTPPKIGQFGDGYTPPGERKMNMVYMTKNYNGIVASCNGNKCLVQQLVDCHAYHSPLHTSVITRKSIITPDHDF